MPQKKSHPARRAPRLPAWFAVFSGVLLGLAFPPVDAKWLVWAGLVPLLLAIEQSRRPRHAFLLGALAGLAFFLLTLHPLISAHSWTGWASESPAAFAHRLTRQWWFMQGIWMAFSLWCAMFWGCWAALLHRLAREPGARQLLLAPCLWVLLPEWARAQTTFGFAWAFFGNATADLAAIRQLAALGGVWGLSALVVLVNVGFSAVLRRRTLARWWSAPMIASAALVVSSIGGVVYLHRPLRHGEPFMVAALQHHKAEYVTSDFADTGLDRSYLPLVQKALTSNVRLVVLPESIALGAMNLDGTHSQAKPREWEHPRSGWDAQMHALLAGTSSVLVLGIDTVEGGLDHNTLVAWTAGGPLGWYHKRRLVPFSEYQPWGWGSWAIRGRSQYFPGRESQLIRAPGMVLGGFICQEVLFPWVTRTSVRDGATLLVTGGNDGVFQDPAVARVHADAAQLRAVETGRYIVRAMKTGISAILDPHGRELVRSRSSEPALLTQQISALKEFTPYVRFGDWVVWASLLVVAASFLLPPANNRLS